jgi:predicted amidophosphoribosyltransferase
MLPRSAFQPGPLFRSVLPGLLQLALPGACALCGGRCNAVLCPPCQAQFFGQARPRCRQCANPLASEAEWLCGRCLAQPPAFDATLAAADYALPVDQLVLS